MSGKLLFEKFCVREKGMSSVICKAWFWLLLISIALFITFVCMFEYGNADVSQPVYSPAYSWTVAGIALILFITAFILYAMDAKKEKEMRERAIACGWAKEEPKVYNCDPCYKEKPPCANEYEPPCPKKVEPCQKVEPCLKKEPVFTASIVEEEIVYKEVNKPSVAPVMTQPIYHQHTIPAALSVQQQPTVIQQSPRVSYQEQKLTSIDDLVFNESPARSSKFTTLPPLTQIRASEYSNVLY